MTWKIFNEFWIEQWAGGTKNTKNRQKTEYYTKGKRKKPRKSMKNKAKTTKINKKIIEKESTPF